MVEEKKKEEERWGVQLAIVDENTPPQRIIVDSKAANAEEGNFDMHTAIAKLLNNQEKLLKLLD